MKGGENKTPGTFGYTIIEVMIFLAISGLTFIIAANFISGKEQKAEFNQGMHSIATEINGVINDVYNGSYPSLGTLAGSTLPCLRGNPGTLEGSNTNCVFMGKVMQFGVSGSGSAGTGYSGYNVYTVSGNQFQPGNPGQVATTFADAAPTAVTSTYGLDLTEHKGLDGGVLLTKVYDANTDPTKVMPTICNPTGTGAIGFFGSFGNYVNNSLASGSQTVVVTCVPGTHLDQGDITTNIGSITDTPSPSDVLSSPDIVLCFAGGTNQTASITIGGISGQQTTVDLEMGRGNTSC